MDKNKFYTKASLVVLIFLIKTVCAVNAEEISEEVTTNYRWSLGCLFPLSGKYSFLGDRALRGVRVAVESSEVGKFYKVVVKDTESSSSGVKNAFTEIFLEDKPSFVLGPIPSNQAVGINSLVNTNNTPTVVFPVLSGNLLKSSKFIKFYLPMGLQVKTIVDFAIGDLKLRKFGVLYPKTKVGEIVSENFVKLIRKNGGRVLYKSSYDAALRDIDTEIEWIKSYKIEALFIPDGATKSSVIVRRIISNRDITNIVFLGPSTWNSSSFLNFVADDIDGVLYKAVFTDFFYPESKDWIEFSELYRSLYNEKPGSFEFQVYKAARLFLPLGEGDLNYKLRNLSQADSDYLVDININGVDIHPKPMVFALENGKITRIK